MPSGTPHPEAKAQAKSRAWGPASQARRQEAGLGAESHPVARSFGTLLTGGRKGDEITGQPKTHCPLAASPWVCASSPVTARTPSGRHRPKCPTGPQTGATPTFEQVRERGATVTRDRVVPLPNVLEQLVDVVPFKWVQARCDVVALRPREGRGGQLPAGTLRPPVRLPVGAAPALRQAHHHHFVLLEAGAGPDHGQGRWERGHALSPWGRQTGGHLTGRASFRGDISTRS